MYNNKVIIDFNSFYLDLLDVFKAPILNRVADPVLRSEVQKEISKILMECLGTLVDVATSRLMLWTEELSVNDDYSDYAFYKQISDILECDIGTKIDSGDLWEIEEDMEMVIRDTFNIHGTTWDMLIYTRVGNTFIFTNNGDYRIYDWERNATKGIITAPKRFKVSVD